jgi:tetratricopeptide (TPR) repeat protein
MNDLGMNLDEMDKAIEMFESMNKTDLLLVRNEMAMAYAMRGMSYVKDHEFNFAVRDLKKSIEIWESLENEGLPINTEMLKLAREIKAGLIAFSDEDKDEAIKHFNKGIDADDGCDKSELANKYYYAAINYMQKEENTEAIANFSKCIELLSEIDKQQIISDDDLKILSSAYMCRGERHFEIGKVNNALEDYNEAVTIEESLQKKGTKMSNYDIMDLVRLYAGRARTFKYLKITEEAIENFITTLRLNKLVFDEIVFRDEQKDYYFYVDRLLDCLIEGNVELKRFNELMQEFLHDMRSTSKTEEAEKAQNKIFKRLENSTK